MYWKRSKESAPVFFSGSEIARLHRTFREQEGWHSWMLDDESENDEENDGADVAQGVEERSDESGGAVVHGGQDSAQGTAEEGAGEAAIEPKRRGQEEDESKEGEYSDQDVTPRTAQEDTDGAKADRATEQEDAHKIRQNFQQNAEQLAK